MAQNKNARILYIDLARGLTMLTILWGHVMLTGSVNLVVYAFQSRYSFSFPVWSLEKISIQL